MRWDRGRRSDNIEDRRGAGFDEFKVCVGVRGIAEYPVATPLASENIAAPPPLLRRLRLVSRSYALPLSRERAGHGQAPGSGIDSSCCFTNPRKRSASAPSTTR
jgi:hypothetical protein